ncbi:hypothetical protein Defa_15720 [Desulfovibrio sp. TH_2024_36128]|uniref:Antirepressor protein ant N-terminal domain-containing protein n=2 Tax=Desulfovibrio falkowii TaxID=3136602 RepID=A0ABQ0E8P6_9BACT
MSNAQLSPVKFHSDTIFCITHNEQPFTAMKPIVENMGLGWASQTQKLNANKERWGVTMIVIPSENGDPNMLCMPVRKLPAYMNSINPKKVRPELRAKIELYQNESDDALWAYWNEGQAVRPVVLHSGDTLTPSEQSHLHAIVSAKAGMLPADMQRKVRSEIWTRFNRHFRIARYAQLPPAKMGEAVEYLVSMEVRAAQKALPQSNSEMAAASSLANYNQQIANTKPVHIFQRMGLTPLEELQMGSPIKRMFDGLDMDKIGPRTMEALVLKAKYVNAISEVYRLNRHLLKDMDRLMHDINGPAMKALNKSGCFADPVADTLHEPRERLDRINEEYRAAARAALDGSICMAMMIGV